ncbi:hypothetical protein QJS10_CPA07g01340 [Acorus calamus]|uniref:ABC transporter domain-containing protein n=1 Tax=Acorus calamus TaxID=4465 RepID=A0AAV9EFZ0_ACOCL|nr:hypothetical protein QJS10_CPA07g01340 [Acorus calamus]
MALTLPSLLSTSSAASSPCLPPHRTLFTGPSTLSLNRSCRRRRSGPRASVAFDSPAEAGERGGSSSGELLLEVRGLSAVISESKKEVLRSVDLTVHQGEIHAIMGRNGSGKSTFSKVLAGHPQYEVTGGVVTFKGQNLLDMDPEERSHAGLFTSFQDPVEIPGISNYDFLLMAYNARQKKLNRPEIGPIEFFSVVDPKLAMLKMEKGFLDGHVNGASGGQKKRSEILQLAVLGADLCILDEIDSGLDVDALQDVAKAINGLLTPDNSILMITHYRRLLDYIKPAYVHIMEDGRIIKTGDASLAKQLEEGGFKAVSAT